MDQPSDYSSAKTLTLVLYILYLLAIFTAGILAIVALVVNYSKRDSMQGTIFASHFSWQIRTFWWYLFWNVVAFVPFVFLFFTENNVNFFAGVALSATTFCLATIALSWIWTVYRAVRGLVALHDSKPMYKPTRH